MTMRRPQYGSALEGAGSVGGSAIGGALTAGAGAVATDIYQAIKSAPHNIANIVVQKVEAPFGEALKHAAAIRETDPERARQILQQGYSNYQAGLDAVRQAGTLGPGGKPIGAVQTVVDQSLNNPALWQTVDTLSGQLGMTRANGQLVSASMPGSGFVDGDNNPSLIGSGLSPLDKVAPSVVGPAQGGTAAKPAGSAPTAATGAAATGIVGILGKIFGVNTGGGSQSTIDSLIKLGVPLSASVLAGIESSKAANVQADAANKSAQLISDAAKNSLDFEKQVYNDQQTQTAPYRTVGTNALDKIQTYLGIGGPTAADGTPRLDPSAELTTTPRYKLDFGEGIKAMNAANRGIISGSTIKAAERFGQGLADKTFDSNFNNLSTVAGLGQAGTSQSINSGNNAVNTTTGINTNSALGIGNAQQEEAAARASGYGSGIGSQVLNEIQKQQLLKQLGF